MTVNHWSNAAKIVLLSPHSVSMPWASPGFMELIKSAASFAASLVDPFDQKKMDGAR